MNTELQTLQTVVTMDSRTIAEITGKRHDNVMTDCKKLENYYLEIYSPEKSGELMKTATYKDSLQRTYPCYELSKEAVLDLITGYSLPHRHAVNKRWMELGKNRFVILSITCCPRTIRKHLSNLQRSSRKWRNCSQRLNFMTL